MILTISQKLKIALVKTAINIIWMFDVFTSVISKNLLVQSLWNLSLASLVLFTVISPFYRGNPFAAYKKQVGMFHGEVTNQVLGDPRVLASINSVNPGSNVLGSNADGFGTPVLAAKSAFPYLSAQAHLIIDNSSGKVLSEHNIHRTFAPASTTKLMTALISKELYELEDIISMPAICADVESTKLWLPVGDYFYVEDLLSSLLISSAADSGCALAVSSLGLESFVELMNTRAKDIGMYDTSFTNPIGLDGANGSHYSTVWDLYILSKEIMKDSFFRETVRTKDYSFTNIDGSLDVNISSTNKLLWEIPGSVGIKTGRTSGAGEVLVYRFVEGNADLTIIVMASDNRFLDTRNLLEWTLSSYSWN